MINLPSSYKLKMLSYRAKSILRGIVGKRGERKRARIFSIFAVLAIVVLISSLSIYGFNLRSRAQGETNISAAGDITNNYNYNYQGISIHTKAETLKPDGITPRGDATVIKGGTTIPPATTPVPDIVKFTLTISNACDLATTPSCNPTLTDVKFTLPTGFTFIPSSASLAPTSGPDSTGTILWNNYSAPSGDSTIIFNTNGPA